MLAKKDVVDLYLRYGFEPGPDYEQYLVFFSQNGYFQNAEIVIIDENFDVGSIDKSVYEDIGFSVRIKSFKDIDSVHEALFNGFFKTTMSNKKLLFEYNTFCSQQTHKLADNQYEYISGSFVENGLIHSGDVISRILDLFSSDDRQLIILEASAGYGKTCTSFEVIRYLIEKMPAKIPLMAELSKNRKANVFRYVLLSEIDQKFPALSSDLVTSEIKEGRIILIIDGFDELLSKSYLSQQDGDHPAGKDAQTMLDTIAQLIPVGSKTKILLTSRKSSIFVGENFDNWITGHLAECNITRLQLSPPSLRDWIGADKIELLRKNSIDINNILNPVLLTLLRNEPLDGFESKYTSNDELIEQYLHLLLQREQIRQALPLQVEEQISIMQDLAVQMVQFDISAEEVDFIKLILSDIVSERFEEYLNRYDYLPDSLENKPSESEFLTKLSQHALLDRVSPQNNQIGFINEFIFGLLIADAVILKKMNALDVEGKYLDLAVTAYAAYCSDKRNALYELLEPALCKETAQRRITASMNLIQKINGIFTNEYFDGLFFGKNLEITDNASFKNCIFSGCIFDHCIINTDAFKTCQFYNCSFYENQIITGSTLDCELIFLSCTGHEQFASLAYRENTDFTPSMDYERAILEQFWKPGYDRAEPNRAYPALLKGSPSDSKKALADAIDSLVKKNILIKKVRVFELNFEKMDVIREIVGR